jgi:hypothetical protein
MSRLGSAGRGQARGPYSVKDGKKLCRGPTHPPGGKWLPADENYFQPDYHGVGLRWYSWCRQCRGFTYNKKPRSVYGWTLVERYLWAFEELANRVGKTEAARRCGISYKNWKAMMDGEQKRAEKMTIVRVLKVLRDVRANDEVRHAADIKLGRPEYFVLTSRYFWAFDALESRLGRTEAARRCGLSRTNWRLIMIGTRRRITKNTVASVLTELHKVLSDGEVRHIDDIIYGPATRRPQKIPKNRSDLYRPHGDHDAILARNRRKLKQQKLN